MTGPAGSSGAKVVERRIAVAPGVELHVEVRVGDRAAAPFVLVHGLASNARLWDGVAEHLHGAGHTVVAIDQRGHGRSDAPDLGYDLDTAVADLLALINALELDRPVLAGQSWGGNVVLELGWRRPEVVRGIACVDGGVIELSQAYPSWEECLAALTPPALDHLTLAELSGSPTLTAQYAAVRATVNDLLDCIPLLVRNLEHSQRQHAALVEAVLDGDADGAREMMREHCAGTAALLRGFLA